MFLSASRKRESSSIARRKLFQNDHRASRVEHPKPAWGSANKGPNVLACSTAALNFPYYDQDVMAKELNFAAKLTISGMLLAVGLSAWQETVDTRPVVFEAVPPTGTENLPVQWMKVSAPVRGVMLLAIASPVGSRAGAGTVRVS
jgi:hypothetical protein